MRYLTKVLNASLVFGAITLCFVSHTSLAFGGGEPFQEIMTLTKNESGDQSASSPRRIIDGIVEAVNENTIKVKAGPAGELTPRYFDVERLKGKADSITVGDRLKITLNEKNVVVDYRLANDVP